MTLFFVRETVSIEPDMFGPAWLVYDDEDAVHAMCAYRAVATILAHALQTLVDLDVTPQDARERIVTARGG